MGMVVRTNSMAINANRQLGMNQNNVQKSLEKLSSGFKINRAADDASGLAISEKMKAQIKGLDQAAANSQDGISLIQTAEGATTEIHDMLNRMVELATKSANGTIKNEVDREAIQKEVDDLNSEISRIAQSTNFNGINLLDGTLSSAGAAAAAGVPSSSGIELSDTAAQKSKAGTAAFTAMAATPTADGNKIGMTVNYTDAKGEAQSVKVEFSIDTTNHKMIAADGTEYAIADTTDSKPDETELQDAFLKEFKKTELNDTFKMTATAAGTDTIEFEAKTAGASTKIDSILSDFVADAANTAYTTAPQTLTSVTAGADAFQSSDFASNGYATGEVFTVGGKKFAFVDSQADAVNLGSGVNAVVVAGAGTVAAGDVTDMADLIEQKTGYKPTANGTSLEFKAAAGTAGAAVGGLKLQVGDTNADYNHVTVSVDNLTAQGIGTAGLDVSTQDAAGDAVDTIKAAINQVSTNRANLGSLQNRLEHTINNLNVTSENMTAANSAIRDTDMAKEMMNYTKMNVLTQAAQAMLAQANQQPQAILQLLQ